MKATGKRRNARCAPICTHNAERGRGETTFNKLVSRASDGHTKRKMYGLAVLRLARSARLTSFTDSVLSSPLLSWNGSWTWTDRKGGRARRRARASGRRLDQRLLLLHTQKTEPILPCHWLRPSVRPSVRRRLLKSELSWEAIAREAVSSTDRLWVASFWNYGRGCRIPDWVVTCIDESSLKYFAPETVGLETDSVF